MVDEIDGTHHSYLDLEHRIRDLGTEPVGGSALDYARRRVTWIMNRVKIVCEWVDELEETNHDLYTNACITSHVDTLGDLVNEVKRQFVK